MNNKLTINIDGKECECNCGEYLYDVATRNGIFIPKLCRNDAFEDHRACCRICIVEVEERGRTKIVTSCVYPVNSAIIVRTNTDKIKEERAVIMALLNKRAPEAKLINNMASYMGGLDKDGFSRMTSIDSEKCILCGLCVQACDSLGTGAISTINRGTEKEVDTPYKKENSTCIGCLSCANVCPVGAIDFTDNSDKRRIWHKDFELCKCSNCGAILGTKEQFEFANADFSYDADMLCDSCKKKLSANKMKKVIENL